MSNISTHTHKTPIVFQGHVFKFGPLFLHQAYETLWRTNRTSRKEGEERAFPVLFAPSYLVTVPRPFGICLRDVRKDRRADTPPLTLQLCFAIGLGFCHLG